MSLQPLERILQAQGFGSRKMCRQWITAGRITVAGEPVTDPQRRFESEGLPFCFDDEAWVARDTVYILLHKPAGFECSRAPQHHRSVLDLLPAPLAYRGVQPAGRLDQDTTGLLLLSDDGQFLHRIASPKRHAAKVYHATCKHPISEELLAALNSGVLLHGENAPVSGLARALDSHRLELTLHQGLYHQVKRMIAAAGNRCEALHRYAIGQLTLGPLASGQWRYLGRDELTEFCD